MRGRGKRVYLAAEEPAIMTYEWGWGKSSRVNYPPVPTSQTVGSSTIARDQEGQVMCCGVIGSFLKLEGHL